MDVHFKEYRICQSTVTVPHVLHLNSIMSHLPLYVLLTDINKHVTSKLYVIKQILKINYLRFVSPELPVIEFNDSNHPHYGAKIVSVDNAGYTVGGTDNAKTEILNFGPSVNGIMGTWSDIEVVYPNVQYIYDYAALTIESSVYLYGGFNGYYGDRVVFFENNNF